MWRCACERAYRCASTCACIIQEGSGVGICMYVFFGVRPHLFFGGRGWGNGTDGGGIGLAQKEEGGIQEEGEERGKECS